ncbi:hypothetical protein DN068_21105 [Taibaiella soli]|uniref:Uncharacterized protein n=1 Tax=Taibaiella soli TaxID=1649169 RepID=A0A2W2B470_9BACT|nr:hypothetical protein DN068_21105 [Taibaiella soli]
MMTAEIGIVEQISAAIPLGITFSAQVTSPLPSVISKKPMSACCARFFRDQSAFLNSSSAMPESRTPEIT